MSNFADSAAPAYNGSTGENGWGPDSGAGGGGGGGFGWGNAPASESCWLPAKCESVGVRMQVDETGGRRGVCSGCRESGAPMLLHAEAWCIAHLPPQSAETSLLSSRSGDGWEPDWGGHTGAAAAGAAPAANTLAAKSGDEWGGDGWAAPAEAPQVPPPPAALWARLSFPVANGVCKVISSHSNAFQIVQYTRRSRSL